MKLLGGSVFVVLCFFSCEYSGDRRINKGSTSFEFETIIQLNGESVFENEYGNSVDVAGDFLLFELPSKDTSGNVYNVYNLDDLKFFGSIGSRGRGPGQFYGAQFAGQLDYVDNDLFIWINDAPQYRITSINLTKSLESGGTVVGRVIRHHPEHNFQSYLFVLNDTDLAGYQPGYISNTNLYPFHILKRGALAVNERNGNSEMIHVGEYPEIKHLKDVPDFKDFQKAFNSALVTMRPDQSRFAVAFKQYDRLDIFSQEGKVLNSIRDPEHYVEYDAQHVYEPKLDWQIRDLFDYYRKVISTDRYIYTVYQNRNMGQFNEENGKGVDIRVFDWDGNLKFLMKCPDNIWTLAVDEKNGYIYGQVDNEDRFVRYDVGDLLKVNQNE